MKVIDTETYIMGAQTTYEEAVGKIVDTFPSELAAALAHYTSATLHDLGCKLFGEEEYAGALAGARAKAAEAEASVQV